MIRTSHPTVSAVCRLALVLVLTTALTALAALGIWRMEGAFESPPAVAADHLTNEGQTHPEHGGL